MSEIEDGGAAFPPSESEQEKAMLSLHVHRMREEVERVIARQLGLFSDDIDRYGEDVFVQIAKEHAAELLRQLMWLVPANAWAQIQKPILDKRLAEIIQHQMLMAATHSPIRSVLIDADEKTTVRIFTPIEDLPHD